MFIENQLMSEYVEQHYEKLLFMFADFKTETEETKLKFKEELSCLMNAMLSVLDLGEDVAGVAGVVD